MSDTIARLIAESEIRRTIAAYCQTCDDGRFDDYGACFTEDAVLVIFDEEHLGREAVQAWITTFQPPELRGKHVTVNTLLDIDTEAGTATGATDFVFVGRTPDGLGITTAGRYLDAFVREGSRWPLSRREITFLEDPRG